MYGGRVLVVVLSVYAACTLPSIIGVTPGAALVTYMYGYNNVDNIVYYTHEYSDEHAKVMNNGLCSV